jgi:hypothetical protein
MKANAGQMARGAMGTELGLAGLDVGFLGTDRMTPAGDSAHSHKKRLLTFSAYWLTMKLQPNRIEGCTVYLHDVWRAACRLTNAFERIIRTEVG